MLFRLFLSNDFVVSLSHWLAVGAPLPSETWPHRSWCFRCFCTLALVFVCMISSSHFQVSQAPWLAYSGVSGAPASHIQVSQAPWLVYSGVSGALASHIQVS